MRSTSNGHIQPRHSSPSGLAHVVLRTRPANYQPMINFYMRVLNARIAHGSPIVTFLRYDDEHHRIAILQTPEVEAKPEGVKHAIVDHIAFTYPSLTALARTYQSLKTQLTNESSEDESGRPLLPIWCVNHGPTTSLYYRDPDMNKIELQVENFESVKAADDFMSGDSFQMNPIGVDFDPDDWADQILKEVRPDGGEGLTVAAAQELKRRKEIGVRTLPPEGF